MLTPTRELAAQIGERLRVYGQSLPLFSTVIFGGVGQSPQVKALRRGVDILVATPGRLLDLHEQGHLDLSHVQHFVLDEADRMLDMGFSKDVERILRLMPKRRQNLMFSATMPKAIGTLANEMLYQPVHVDISPEAPTTDRIEQYVSFVRKADKRELLIDLLEGQMVSCGIVFTRTKHGANRLAKQLGKVGIPADSIHGDKSQTARTKALQRFKNGEVFVLVATDIASRGIDVEDITHVFNLISRMNLRSTFIALGEQPVQAERDWLMPSVTKANPAIWLVYNACWVMTLRSSKTSRIILKRHDQNPDKNLAESKASL